MVARDQSRFSTRSTDGTTEASVLQAFLLHLEHEGLVQTKAPRRTTDARPGSEDAAASKPAELESAVRKLITVLRKPS